MTLKFPRLTIAEGTADKVLRELGLDRLPIDPTAIALNKEILVRPAPSDMTGFSGMLAQWDTQFGIMFATHIESEGFRRFSIGHELGHYFLPGHVVKIAAGKCDSANVDLSDWFDCPSSHTVTEDVAGLGSYGKVLTVIYSSRLTNDAAGYDNEESDGEIEERWTPKFHR